uniref:Phosphoinositide-interacting protein n=1 Tax=Panagrolaimus superbus TaxID=310955 RepID=A0A914YKJ7_9BILA
MEPSAFRGYEESPNRNVLRYGDVEINPYPNPEQIRRPATLPILRIETENGEVHRPESASVVSPASQQKNFYYGKRKMEGIKIVNSKNDNQSDKNIIEFDFQRETRRKKGPSSPTTVLTMAGLFVCGSTLLLSGIIILCQQDERPFIITGSVFLGVGALMVIICGFLQRKNVIKYVLDINRDLYFLKMDESYMWKLMFRDEISALPHQH